jgi:hypothetical protein
MAGVEAERDVSCGQMQRLAGDDGIVDHYPGRKNAGKERVQRTAVIGVVGARAGVRMRALVRVVPIGVTSIGMVRSNSVVIDPQNGSARSRAGLRRR